MPPCDTYGSFFPLSDEHHRSQKPEDGKLPEPDQDRSLESAIAEFGGSLSPDGTGDGDEDPPDYAACFRSLEDKARELGVLYDRWQPAYVVDFDLGYPSLAPALPIQYLERQALHNAVFADAIHFVGVAGDPTSGESSPDSPIFKVERRVGSRSSD